MDITQFQNECFPFNLHAREFKGSNFVYPQINEYPADIYRMLDARADTGEQIVQANTPQTNHPDLPVNGKLIRNRSSNSFSKLLRKFSFLFRNCFHFHYFSRDFQQSSVKVLSLTDFFASFYTWDERYNMGCCCCL